MIKELNQNLEEVITRAQKTEDKELTEVRSRIRSLEETVEDQDSEVTEDDLETVVDELDRQEDEIKDIREGYEELGEMMRLILQELRETRGMEFSN
jgi:ribosomal protein S20